MIAAGTLLAVSALSALAQAGGQGAMGYFQGKAAEENQEWDKKKWLKEMQDKEEDRRTESTRYRNSQIAAAPGNNVSLLSGLSNLQQGMAKPTSLDYLGMLARG